MPTDSHIVSFSAGKVISLWTLISRDIVEKSSIFKWGLDRHINNKYLNCYIVELLFVMQI